LAVSPLYIKGANSSIAFAISLFFMSLYSSKPFIAVITTFYKQASDSGTCNPNLTAIANP